LADLNNNENVIIILSQVVHIIYVAKRGLTDELINKEAPELALQAYQ
jgi:hypothetical protein